MLDRITPPEINTIDRIEFQEPVIKELSNGIKVLGFNLGSQNVVQIELIFHAGIKNSENNLVATYMGKMLGEASQKYEVGEIMDKIDYYGAFFESSTGKDYSQVSLFSLEKQLDHVLPVFSEALLHAKFPESILNVHLKNGKHKFIIQNEKVGFRCRNLFNSELFKGHPYGTIVSKESYDTVTSRDLEKYYKEYFHAGNCFIIVAGKFHEDLYDKLDKAFGNFGTEEKIVQRDIVTAFKPGKVFEEKKGAIQSGIRIGKILDVEYGSADYQKLKVLNTVLGGYFGSRLMSNIREDKGYTYGIGSAVASFTDAGFFVISTEVGSNVTADALKEIYHEIDRLRNEPVSEEELEMVKNYMLGSLLKNSDGPFSMAERYKSVYIRGKQLSYYNEYIHTINTVTAEELMNVANKYLAADSFLEVVVGPG